MPPHGRYGNTAIVRYRSAEAEFEMRCPDCARADRQCYWPLTVEFWDPRSLQRCRACEAAKRARYDREKRQADPEWAKNKARKYFVANKRTINLKRNHRRALARAAAAELEPGAAA